MLMLKIGANFVIAATIGTIVGIVNGYYWNKLLVFRSKSNELGEKVKFVTVHGVKYISNIFLIYVCISIIRLSAELAGLVGVSFGMVIGFIAHI